MENLVKFLIKRKQTISSMESCTGGLFASEITNVEGSSEILKCSLVTYSNEFKIKFGVDKNIIDKYTVYSSQTAKEMAIKVSKFTNSDYGIGITGQIGRNDPNNQDIKINEAYFCIFNKNNNKCYNYKVSLDKNTRLENKYKIANEIKDKFLLILGEDING